jgi:uncharacterized protein (TIGR03067 family)
MTFRVVIILGVSFSSPGFAGETERTNPDSTSIQGEWRCVDAECAGVKCPKEEAARIRFVFEGDRFFGWEDTPSRVPRAAFRLDPRSSPKGIDLVVLNGPDRGKTFAGIYALENGKLKLCLHNIAAEKADEQSRPKKFETKKGEPVVLYILDREEPVKDEQAPSSKTAEKLQEKLDCILLDCLKSLDRRLGEQERTMSSPAKAAPPPASRPEGVVEFLLSLGGVRIDIYSSDPNRRIQELLKNAEDMRRIEYEWERIWFTDHPLHLTPERVDGPIR